MYSARDTQDDARDASVELEAVLGIVMFFWCNCGATHYYRCDNCDHVHSGGHRMDDFRCAICDEPVNGLLTCNREE